VIHHGVSEIFRVTGDVRSSRSIGANPTFVTIATLERRKNLSTLIDAFAQVAKQRPAARLRLIGQADNDLAGVRKRLAGHRLENAVTVEGHIADDAVVRAYESAVATVYPSLYEGFGLPLIESMAAGTPVIAADLKVTREVAGDAAIFVDPYDCGAIAHAMLQLLDDASLRESLSEAGIRRAAQFTWERSALEHAQVYREALELAERRKAR
jgi:glycosyltransferase involved in cell wall biosynthesis